MWCAWCEDGGVYVCPVFSMEYISRQNNKYSNRGTYKTHCIPHTGTSGCSSNMLTTALTVILTPRRSNAGPTPVVCVCVCMYVL